MSIREMAAGPQTAFGEALAAQFDAVHEQRYKRTWRGGPDDDAAWQAFNKRKRGPLAESGLGSLVANAINRAEGNYLAALEVVQSSLFSAFRKDRGRDPDPSGDDAFWALLRAAVGGLVDEARKAVS